MTTPTHPRHRNMEKPFVCRRCGGPARAFLGSRHRWTCRGCIETYIDAQGATQ